MSKALMYAVNTNDQTGTINFGSIIRRYGKNINLSGGNPVIRGEGYYRIDTNFNITGGAAGLVTIGLYRNGVLIPGSEVSLTVANTVQYVVAMPSVAVREYCCNESNITAVISGVAATVTNATILVEKE